MTGLKKILLQEQERLEHILEKTETQLLGAPEGSLRIAGRGKWTQYYHYLPGGRRSGTYIAAKEKAFVRALAQKSYDLRVQKLVKKRLAQLEKITGDFEDDELELIFQNETNGRKKLIRPAEPIWEQQLQAWTEKPHEGKAFSEDSPVILTESGERVRSKSEKILADCFFRSGIPYKYECPLYLKGFGTVYPDFTFLSKKTRQEIYWEHFGRIDDPVYAQSAVRKLQAYEENEIWPGERLLLTFETEKTLPDSRLINEMIAKHLLPG